MFRDRCTNYLDIAELLENDWAVFASDLLCNVAGRAGQDTGRPPVALHIMSRTSVLIIWRIGF
jgi:hypothetical protein